VKFSGNITLACPLPLGRGFSQSSLATNIARLLRPGRARSSRRVQMCHPALLFDLTNI
jgi:hypothetical protein